MPGVPSAGLATVRPTPPTEVVEFAERCNDTSNSEVVEFPERCDDTSNAPLPAIDKLVSTDPSTERVAKPIKRDESDLCLPNAKKTLHHQLWGNQI